MFSQSAFRFIERNRAFSSALCAGSLCIFIYWWYNVSIRQTLLQTQRNCQQISDKAFLDCRELLKNEEANWNADIRARDAQVRRLELQNVEQTRSVARLEAALKMCLIQTSS